MLGSAIVRFAFAFNLLGNGIVVFALGFGIIGEGIVLFASGVITKKNDFTIVVGGTMTAREIFYMSDEYLQKLKNPKWQKKRLEIFERDEWKCTICGSQEQTLHVHHKKYFADTEPWDYDNKYLETLCEECHYNEHYNSRSGSAVIVSEFSYDEFISKGKKPVSKIKADKRGRKFINFRDEETKGVVPIYLSGLACDLYDVGEIPSKSQVIIYLMETRDESIHLETETITPKGARFCCIKLISSLENNIEMEKP